MKKLNELPNIGKVLVQRLEKVGIYDPNELIKLGSKEVYKRLLEHEKDTCIETLYALEGAVKGIRWHNLSDDEMKDLREFFNNQNNR